MMDLDDRTYRTILNEKQLHTLRTVYAGNPKPDELMLEQLVEMTSLSPREIRLWFKNKRRRDSRNNRAEMERDAFFASLKAVTEVVEQDDLMVTVTEECPLDQLKKKLPSGSSESSKLRNISGNPGLKPVQFKTFLNEKQLLALRTCYAKNPRPTLPVQELLVDMTGLSLTEIRVWFKNKRYRESQRIQQNQLPKEEMRQRVESHDFMVTLTEYCPLDEVNETHDLVDGPSAHVGSIGQTGKITKILRRFGRGVSKLLHIIFRRVR